jgi:hypothetical protein
MASTQASVVRMQQEIAGSQFDRDALFERVPTRGLSERGPDIRSRILSGVRRSESISPVARLNADLQ